MNYLDKMKNNPKFKLVSKKVGEEVNKAKKVAKTLEDHNKEVIAFWAKYNSTVYSNYLDTFFPNRKKGGDK